MEPHQNNTTFIAKKDGWTEFRYPIWHLPKKKHPALSAGWWRTSRDYAFSTSRRSLTSQSRPRAGPWANRTASSFARGLSKHWSRCWSQANRCSPVARKQSRTFLDVIGTSWFKKSFIKRWWKDCIQWVAIFWGVTLCCTFLNLKSKWACCDYWLNA